MNKKEYAEIYGIGQVLTANVRRFVYKITIPSAAEQFWFDLIDKTLDEIEIDD